MDEAILNIKKNFVDLRERQADQHTRFLGQYQRMQSREIQEATIARKLYINSQNNKTAPKAKQFVSKQVNSNESNNAVLNGSSFGNGPAANDNMQQQQQQQKQVNIYCCNQ